MEENEGALGLAEYAWYCHGYCNGRLWYADAVSDAGLARWCDVWSVADLLDYFTGVIYI